MIPSTPSNQVTPHAGVPIARTLACLALVTFLSASAHGADISKNDTINPLNDGSSWVGGAAPDSADTAVIDNQMGIAPLTPSLGASMTWNGIRVANTAGGVLTIGATPGQILTLGTGGIDMSAAAQDLTIQAALALTGGAGLWDVVASRTLSVSGTVANGGNLLTVNCGGNASISGVISGAGGLTKTGAGTLTLSGANTFSGVLRIESGMLSVPTINNVSANGTLGNSANPVTLGSASAPGALRYTGTAATVSSSKPFVFDGPGAIIEVVNAGTALTLSGGKSGGGGMVKTGLGELRFITAASSYTGKLVIQDGTFTAGLASRIGAAPDTLVEDHITIDNGAGLHVSTAGTATTIDPNMGITIGPGGGRLGAASGAIVTVPGPISGTGNLTNSGASTGSTLPTVSFENVNSAFSGDVYFVANGSIFRLAPSGQLGTGTFRWAGGSLSILGDRSITENFIGNPIVMTDNLTLRNSTASPGLVNAVFSSDSITTSGGTLTINNALGGASVMNVWFSGSGFDFTQPIVMTSSGTAGSVFLTFGNGSGTTNTFSGPISGINGITAVRRTALTGQGGTTILSGVNSYTGPTLIESGTLLLAVTGSIDNSAEILVWNGATFDVSAVNYTLATGQSLGGAGTVRGNVQVAAGASLSPGFSSPSAAGTLQFANHLTLDGGSTAAFKLSVNPNSTTANDRVAVTGNLDISSGVSTIHVSAAALGAGRYKLFTYGGNLVGDSNNLTLSGVTAGGRQTAIYLDTSVAGEITLVVVGAGAELRWVGDGSANQWDINLTANWLNTGTATPDYFFNSDFVTFDDSGSKSPDVFLMSSLFPGSLLISNNTGTYTFSGGGGISGGTDLVKQGDGTLVLANAFNDYTGETIVSGGTLHLNGSTLGAGKTTISSGGAVIGVMSDFSLGTAPVLATEQLVMDGGRLQTTASMIFDGNRHITLGPDGGAFDTANGGLVTYGGVISGPGGFTKIGDGTLSLLTNPNTFAGKVVIHEGTLNVGLASRLGAEPEELVADQVTIDNGAKLACSAVGSTTTSGPNRGFRIGAGGAVIGLTTSGNSSAFVIQGPISGSGNLTNASTGNAVNTIQFDDLNTDFSGDVYFVSGGLRVNAAGQFGTGKLYWHGGLLSAANDRGTTGNYITNAIEIEGNFVVRGNNSGESTSPRNIVFSTDSLTTISGNVTFENIRNVAGHIYAPWFAGAGFDFTLPITLAPSETIGNAVQLSFGNAEGTSQTFSGPISGIGTLRRSALSGTGGTTVLTADNSYTGGTIVDGGTLLVNNTSGSGTGTGGVTLSAPGTLGGTGTIAGPVSGHGNVSPGSSIGALTLNGGLNLSSGGAYIWELGANSVEQPGVNYDVLSLTGGTLVLGGSSKIQIAFTGSASAPDASNPFWQSARTWRVVSLNGGTNPGATTFGLVLNGIHSAGFFTIEADANGILLHFTPGGQPMEPEIDPFIAGAGTASATLTWSAQNGINYQVQYKTNVNQPGWLVLGNVAATGTTASFTDNTGPHSERYYRVVVP